MANCLTIVMFFAAAFVVLDGGIAAGCHCEGVFYHIAQERRVSQAPGCNDLVIVTISHRAADQQKQDFPQRMRNTPWIARILNQGQVVLSRFNRLLKTSLVAG